MIYLIEYDRSSGKLLRDPLEFDEDDRPKAQALRLEKELQEAGNLDREILLLEAASFDDLTNNHGRYFASIEELTLRIQRDLNDVTL